MEIPDTRYVKSPDGAYIAYQTVGEGPDIAYNFDYFGDIDIVWEVAPVAHLLAGLASFSRLILHDRRGTGLSSRNVSPPNLETRVADLREVLDAVGSTSVVLDGANDAGAVNALFAATYPDRVKALVWWNPLARALWAPDYPWGVGPDYIEKGHQDTLQSWGTAGFGASFVETEKMVGHSSPEGLDRVIEKQARHTVTPDVAVELDRIWLETDIRDVLPAVRAPSLLMCLDHGDGVDEARYVAALMPKAELKLFQGEVEGDPDVADASLAEIQRFIGVERPASGLDTVLLTVLFTDIVDSTKRQARAGDRKWKGILERHHALVRGMLERWRGVENDTAGDGFFATFDGPARAIRCALEIVERVRELGIEIRAGVHTGECEIVDGKASGIAVSTGARISSLAQGSEVLVSETVKGLVAGSGFTFEDAGEHELKGVPDRWHLYRVAS